MITIMIVDDSPTDTAILRHIFESEPNLSVIACARNGREAVDLVPKLKPNVIAMDIQMPVMDGYEATDTIMRQWPTPIVMISSAISDSESEATFRSLESGALTVLPKPRSIGSNQYIQESRYLVDTIKSMAEIKVIKKRSIAVVNANQPRVQPDKYAKTHYNIIAIGASVGGPQALRAVLSDLPADFPLPIVIVQHMTHGFMDGFTKWLDSHIYMRVKCAEAGELLLPGVIYFAPDGVHTVVDNCHNELYVKLIPDNKESYFCPSISVLMKSIASACGKHAIGVLLTGMGSDGAEGMLELKNKGAHTIIQDEKSSVVFGMAGVAKSLGAVDKTIDLVQIAKYLSEITK